MRRRTSPHVSIAETKPSGTWLAHMADERVDRALPVRLRHAGGDALVGDDAGVALRQRYKDEDAGARLLGAMPRMTNCSMAARWASARRLARGISAVRTRGSPRTKSSTRKARTCSDSMD